ncbi:unnamed protein product [Paramecium sonneborni]|uniref:Uncharacterized protein n=1 Tax=Paramecium sonneborni TaxID=65129 RepID=A0A8S1MIW9_9CILI|nr:unnamed protein product [Paramecium sonneborni]
MGLCSSSQQKHPRPLIRLVKVEMDNKEVNQQYIQSLWRKINDQIVLIKNNHQISLKLLSQTDKINNFLLLNERQNVNQSILSFFKLFDEFQIQFAEEIRLNETFWMDQSDLLRNFDQLCETFAEMGFCSKVLTQSLTKY